MEEKKTTEESKEKAIKSESEEVKFKGKFLAAVGRRKTSVAQVRLYKKGNGLIIVNGLKASRYFNPERLSIVFQSLKSTKLLREFNFSVMVTGGGVNSQAEAVRHGISQTLIKHDEELKSLLKTNGWLTRDARKKERKKPGLKKARKAPQWSKR